MRRAKVILSSFLVGGCVATPSPEAASAVPDSIAYETGPCFGACPVYRIVVNREGGGSFEGIRSTAVAGLQSFRTSQSEYRRFAAALAPFRPISGSMRYSGPPLCRTMATDLPSVTVTWTEGGQEQSLYYYYGCDMEDNRAVADRLRAAPAELPVAQFISKGE